MTLLLKPLLGVANHTGLLMCNPLMAASTYSLVHASLMDAGVAILVKCTVAALVVPAILMYGFAPSVPNMMCACLVPLIKSE